MKPAACVLPAVLALMVFAPLLPAQVRYQEPGPVVRKAVGNTVLADPFPGDSALAPTLVTLKLGQRPWREALEELGRQAKVEYTFNTPARWEPTLVEIDLEKQPYLEALRQIAAQGGIHIHPMPCPSFRPIRGNPLQSTGGNLPATVWCISGPFCYVVRSIEHQIDLPGRQDRLSVELMLDCEPKMHVLAWPREVEQLEAVDEKGNSLVPVVAPATQPREIALQKQREQERAAKRIPHWSDPKSYYMAITLAYPKQDAGKRIAKLKALAPWWIQTQSETLELEDPAAMQPLTREIGGVEVTVSPMVQKNDSWIIQLSFKRTTLPAEQWAERAFALSAIRPMLAMDNDEWKWPIENDFKLAGDQASRAYSVYASTRGPALQPKKLVVAVPLEVRRVMVPIELTDLPLP